MNMPNLWDALLGKVEWSEFIFEAVRQLFMFIDALLYRFMTFMYQLFAYVSSVNILDEEIAYGIYQRVTIMLGVFMVFALAFSLLQILIDPDKMTDKSKGISKVITKIIVSVVLLATVNTIFTEARNLQNQIMNQNVIGKIITGRSFNNDDPLNMGLNFSKQVLFSFVRQNPSVTITNDLRDINYYVNGIKSEGDFAVMNMIINSKEGKAYAFDYDFIVSTLTAGFICWMLISYIVKVGMRSIQLAFLQIISPIPILTYIVPGGEKYLKNWATQAMRTFLDLFIRVAIIYFVFYVITLLNEKFSGVDFFTTDYSVAKVWGIQDGLSVQMFAWIKILMILALMMFAKKVPEMIKHIFGGEASFGVGLKDNPLGAALYASTIGARGAGPAGALSGLLRGAVGGAQGKTAKDIKSDQIAWNKSFNQRDDGSTFFGRKFAQQQQAYGGRTAADYDDAQIQKIENGMKEDRRQAEIMNKLVSADKSIKDSIVSEAEKDTTVQVLKTRMEQIQRDPTKTDAEIEAATKKYIDTRKATAKSIYNDAMTNPATTYHDVRANINERGRIVEENRDMDLVRGITTATTGDNFYVALNEAVTAKDIANGKIYARENKINRLKSKRKYIRNQANKNSSKR